MCLAIPGKIIFIEGNLADVDFGGVLRKVNISLVDARIGEWVMVHAGFAIQTIDEEEAKETLKFWEELLAQS
ncbi:MAG: HypC/HybG/HupF family hydrogenase formation chaperone [Methanomassiliicoccales archaeon]|jgi:hydrogenase expression/formation protein HypC|nr:HypC/HybG/HupF family hydrogenase formation chaperone [Methanomassiliicoccales archaeon]